MFIAADKEYRGINLHEHELKNKEERTTRQDLADGSRHVKPAKSALSFDKYVK